MSNLIILFGAPGSGKGTQAKKITEKYNYIHISTGDMLRKEIEKETDLGKDIKNIIESGQLVNDEIIQKLLVANIEKNKNYIFDGFPRNIKQAEFLDEFIYTKGLILKNVLYLNLTEDDIIKRILGRRVCSSCRKEFNIFIHNIDNNICPNCAQKSLEVRTDDNEETIKKRINVYFKETLPLIDYYSKKGILLNINANETIENISKYIFSNIG